MKYIILFLTISLFYSCGDTTTSSSSSITGLASGVADGTKIYLEELGANNKRIPVDTAIVVKETFVLDNKLAKEKNLLVLTVEGNRTPFILINDKSKIDITLYKDSISSSLVKGSIGNERFNKYRNESIALAEKRNKLVSDMQKAQRETDGIMVTQLKSDIATLDKNAIDSKKDVVKNNPDLMVSIMALSDLINSKTITVEETEGYFNALSPDIQSSTVGIAVNQYIAQLKSQRIASKLADVGNKAPEFTAKTPEGKDLALSDALGKYTIIDFWASWCRPCRMENPNVVNVYNEYHDKGLNIISVSLDRPGQNDRWKKAIIQDKMDWYHVSNLQFWQDPIPKKYGVRAIPATFLLDENGVIIAKNLRGPALGAKMKELLGKS